MAKIDNKNFISEDFGQPAILALKEILKLTDELIGTLKKVGNESEGVLEGLSPKDSVKDTKKLNEVLERLVETEKQLNKLTEDKKKVTADLKKLEDQKLKQDKAALDLALKSSKAKQEEQKLLLAEQKVVQQNLRTSIARRKERERQFKAREKDRASRKKQLTEYQKESRRLTELRNRYKDLAVAEKENTKEAKDLLKEVTKLDKKLKEIDETVGQNQRSVGDYGKALEGLNGTIAKLGIVAAITKGIEVLGSAFGDTREGALQLQILFSKFTETAKVFIQSVINSGAGVKEIFSSITSSVSNSFKSAILEAKIFKKSIDETFLFGDSAKEAQKEIEGLKNQLKKLEESETGESIAGGIEKIKKAFEGNVSVTSQAINQQEEFLRLQLKTRISISEQEKALAGLAEQRQILQDISDDDTLSFIERGVFIEKANEAAVKFAALENKLALDKERLTIEAIKQDLRRAKALSESRIEAIKTGEDLQKELKNEAVAKKVSDANDEAFNAAFIERVDKEIEVRAFQRDQEEKQRKTKRDDFEQELDIIEELGEQTIAINQKVIADQSKSLKQRQAALAKNNEQEKKIFKEGIDRIRQQGTEAIQSRNDLTEAQKAERIELIKTADINAILNEQDQVKALEAIKNIQLDEIATQRLKDLLKIKKDISLQNEEDAKALEEANLKTLELQEAIAIQEQKLANDKFDLDKAEIDNQKENLQERIDLLEEDSVKRLELEKQLNELLLDEQQERIDKQEEAEQDQLDKEKENAEKRAELIQKSAELVTNLIEKQNEKRLAAIDKQISEVEERQGTLRSLAENGNEEAVKSLAESEKREAEIRREKEKELQRQQRIEAGLAAFQVFSANAQQDPETALSKTITDVTALTAFLGGLPSFFVGTEDTGKAGKALDNNGGRLSILHDNERVMTAEQNKRIGNISNEELTRLAVDSTRGTFNNFENVSASGPSILIGERESIKNEINELIRAVKRNKPVDPSQSFNQRTGVLSEVYQYANKKSKTHKKVFIPTKRK